MWHTNRQTHTQTNIWTSRAAVAANNSLQDCDKVESNSSFLDLLLRSEMNLNCGMRHTDLRFPGPHLHHLLSTVYSSQTYWDYRFCFQFCDFFCWIKQIDKLLNSLKKLHKKLLSLCEKYLFKLIHECNLDQGISLLVYLS